MTRQLQPLDPGRAVAIKRNQHEWLLDVDADAFATAFANVLAEPDATFGAIRIDRSPDRVGRPFAVGERFSGRFCLDLLGGPLSWLAGTALGRFIERAMLSDHAEVLEVTPHRVVYGYLTGSPVAGRSVLEVEPMGPGRCRFRATMEFQEVGLFAVTGLHRFGIRAHDGVVATQVARAARAAAPVSSVGV